MRLYLGLDHRLLILNRLDGARQRRDLRSHAAISLSTDRVGDSHLCTPTCGSEGVVALTTTRIPDLPSGVSPDSNLAAVETILWIIEDAPRAGRRVPSDLGKWRRRMSLSR
jgi:hypothetical protein